MPLTSIVVHVDGAAAAAIRLDYALRLAQLHDAHLVAVHCPEPFRVPEHVRAMIPEEALNIQRREAQAARETARAAFEQACRAAGRTARSEWRAETGEPRERLALHLRYADLGIVGQADPEIAGDGQAADAPGQLAIAAGRPVLVHPYVGTYAGLGEHVLVAWNASREAARAVNDALPLLQRARAVTILAINPRNGVVGHNPVPGADIALHLARHGVRAETAHLISNEMDAGDVILSRAADLGADLLVMGAFGRSRLRELVLGGVTYHVLRHMTLPVLMAH